MSQYQTSIDMELLKKYLVNNNFKFVGIIGGAGSGKSTLSKKLGFTTVHVDNYFMGDSSYRKNLIDNKSKSMDGTLATLNMWNWWDWEKLDADVETLIKQSAKFTAPVLVEGAIIGSDRVLSLLDKIVYVSVDSKTRFLRLLDRDSHKRDFMESMHRFLVTEFSENLYYKYLSDNFSNKIITVDENFGFNDTEDIKMYKNIQHLPVRVGI